jgi:glycyl-tRNA synthetase alpha subunit
MEKQTKIVKQHAKPKGLTFQDLLLTLEQYWTRRGCILQQPYDIEVGAGTMHPETFLRVLGRTGGSTRSPAAGRRTAATAKILTASISTPSFK